MINIIAAIGKNRELGKDNKLLWHLPEDLKRFKKLTNGHPIIMGRKTFESIGRVLPKRLNIVITRNQESRLKTQENLVFVNSLDNAIEAAFIHLKSVKNHQKKRKNLDSNLLILDSEHEVFVIGGGQIFEQALPLADRLYLTIVDKEYEADTFFPAYSEFTKEVERETGESNGLRYTYLTLEK